MMKLTTLPIAERALFARVTRELAKKGERLFKSHPNSRLRETAGTFYRANDYQIIATHVDLETIARELGVMADYERLDK